MGERGGRYISNEFGEGREETRRIKEIKGYGDRNRRGGTIKGFSIFFFSYFLFFAGPAVVKRRN